MNKILVVLALLITVSIANAVNANANEQQYGNNVPLTHNDYVVYSKGSCYSDSGCWTEERVRVTNTDTVGGYFSVSYGTMCDTCKTESVYIPAGGNYIFNIGIFQEGSSPIQCKVNAPTKYVPVVTQTPVTSVTYQIPYQGQKGESCWSSGGNIGRCTGKSVGGFLRGFISGLWNSR